MIKNIIFDFGNVLLEWNEDKIVTNYSNNKEKQEILKQVIFKSDEWFKLDDGSMNYHEAISVFKKKLPFNLKSSVSKKCGMEGYIFDIDNFQNLINELKKRDILV